ncbi:zinc finger protein [Colletotrichum plurivorum]|uniref:Zinc finger protein n=1 Tax=Colletotrichum plurivorum TaxID=2175906 RepID=A0A8H6KPG9_9PEZI|nr:zinc finger protein [Colletotrichum plurivorum]
MESKTSLSLFGDDRRSLNQTPSALRALTSSRLSLSRGRIRRDSFSASSSSSVRSSIDATASPSCVIRGIPQDRCALHRFIVWAAVQRNSCEKMSPAERLECPLLRCRKRFPNHEAMLRHLYTCDQLFTGEYWCYECGRAEKFTDGKCKKCLGHPGKRRRIMSVAKDFFSSLGQKSRNQNAPEPDLDGGVIPPSPPPPPSYDSILVQPQEVELSSSSEILEIDSKEVSHPSPSDNFLSGNMDDIDLLDTFPPRSTAFEPGMSVMPDLSFDWTSQNGFVIDEATTGRDRPSLLVHTNGLVHSQKQRKPATRTKNLSPSNSLRSNASTDTTASYLVSPSSNFSTPWTSADTSITSPMLDGTNSGGFLSRGGSNASRYSNCSLPQNAFISELPANETILPLPQTLPENLGYEPQFTPPPVSGLADTIPGMSNAPVAPVQNDRIGQTVAEAIAELENADRSDAKSFVGSAWDSLKAHVSVSMDKLQHLDCNPLAQRLRFMSPQDIAQTGFNTLNAIVEGGQPKSAIEIICFVHVTYSLSIIVHEDDARSRSEQLYAQALLYGNMLVPGEREPYREVASAIWQPSVSRSHSFKGKEQATPGAQPRPKLTDFLEVTLFFLDELEHKVLRQGPVVPPEVLGSKLWIQHLGEAGVTTGTDSKFTALLKRIACQISQSFSHARGFATQMKSLQTRINMGEINTTRRAEIELIQAGKNHIPPQEYFDNYVPEVRKWCDCLYQESVPAYLPRSVYHAFGIELAQTIINGICLEEYPTHGQGEDSLDEFIRKTTTISEESLNNPMFTPNGTVNMTNTLPDMHFATGTDALSDPRPEFLTSSDGLTSSHNQAGGSPEPPRLPEGGTGPNNEIEAYDRCDQCDYRPNGDPKWFKGSLAKHKKLQHSTEPPKIYKCPYPGCTSQYKKREDNLKQHMQEKGHFVEGESYKRPSKRKKTG